MKNSPIVKLACIAFGLALICSVLVFWSVSCTIPDIPSDTVQTPFPEATEPVSTPEPTPVPTPEPTPVPPVNVDADGNFELYGKKINIYDEILDINHITVDDEGDLVRKLIPCMPNLKTVDMDFCGVSDEAMASIAEQFPDVKIIWRIWFGSAYSVRTDVEKILASSPGAGGNITKYNSQSLKYCKDVKYLDLGHNPGIGDISFLANMLKLEVLIIAMDDVTDEMLKVISNCSHLEFLEIQTNSITDLTPLCGLRELKHLNIGNNPELSDISPIYGLTQLERLWVGVRTKIPSEQLDEMQRLAAEAGNTDLVINRTNYDPHDGWRWGNERYDLLCQQLGYNSLDYQTIWNDPKYLGENHPYY